MWLQLGTSPFPANFCLGVFFWIHHSKNDPPVQKSSIYPFTKLSGSVLVKVRMVSEFLQVNHQQLGSDHRPVSLEALNRVSDWPEFRVLPWEWSFFFVFSRRQHAIFCFFWKDCLGVLSTWADSIVKVEGGKLFKKKMEDLKVKSKRFLQMWLMAIYSRSFNRFCSYIKRLIGAAETIFKIPSGFLYNVLVLFSSQILYVTHFS